ncbi:CopG family transcriptional regulator [Candidatus Poriferisodalis sp.]|uniref:CopG family transcriptional regulator n=1 Tax=Candidatus Poriferisodalis sp. TaxID=3101277 RepID=UPI003B592E27
MSRPTSLRLPEDVRARLDDESQRVSAPPSTLAVVLIDEGLKMRRFPGIVFRDGPTGRRAGLAKGPDVWEVVRDLKRAHGTGRQPVDFVAEETGLAPELIGLAADYYAVFPDEIDDRIATDARVAEELRELADRRERMLST